MTSPTHPATRVVWWWCLAYTAATPRTTRERRRAELASHLWESQRAGLPARSVAWAAARGAWDDLGWALGRGMTALARSFLTPTPYVVLAAALPIQGAIASAVAAGSASDPFVTVGGVGGPAMVLIAAAVWCVGRLRRH